MISMANTLVSRVLFPVLALATSFGLASVQARADSPRIAISGFDSRGLNHWWGSGDFDPGAALADLLESRLVNAHQYTVVDRSQLGKIMTEQNIASAGDVTPATAAKLGHMIGVQYILVGRIIQFAKSGTQSGGLGHFVPGIGGAAGGSSTKTELHATAKIIDVNSGQIVLTMDADQSTSTTSFSLGAVGGGTGGGYSSQDFQSSAMGKLIGSVADDLAKQADPAKLPASVPTVQITGRIISVDGDSIILNVGSDKGVTVGTMFTVIDQKSILDPDSKKTITTEIEKGTIQVVSVSKDSSVAKRVSGAFKTLQVVRSQ